MTNATLLPASSEMIWLGINELFTKPPEHGTGLASCWQARGRAAQIKTIATIAGILWRENPTGEIPQMHFRDGGVHMELDSPPEFSELFNVTLPAAEAPCGARGEPRFAAFGFSEAGLALCAFARMTTGDSLTYATGEPLLTVRLSPSAINFIC